MLNASRNPSSVGQVELYILDPKHLSFVSQKCRNHAANV